MEDTYGYGEEAESWFYSYDGWASRKREEASREKPRLEPEPEFFLESGNILDSQKPDDLNSSYTNQSFLNGEGDLVEVEQVGQQITFKIYKGGLSGPTTRLTLTPKEARTLIMMLATAVEGGPSPRPDRNTLDSFDI
jgi:hypothetical protein